MESSPHQETRILTIQSGRQPSGENRFTCTIDPDWHPMIVVNSVLRVHRILGEPPTIVIGLPESQLAALKDGWISDAPLTVGQPELRSAARLTKRPRHLTRGVPAPAGLEPGLR